MKQILLSIALASIATIFIACTTNDEKSNSPSTSSTTASVAVRTNAEQPKSSATTAANNQIQILSDSFRKSEILGNSLGKKLREANIAKIKNDSGTCIWICEKEITRLSRRKLIDSDVNIPYLKLTCINSCMGSSN